MEKIQHRYGHAAKERLCNRCGKCCVLFDGEKWVDCKFLIRQEDGNTMCSVYETRLGRDIGFGYVCTMVEMTSFDYPECPYNTGKPMHPAYHNG